MFLGWTAVGCALVVAFTILAFPFEALHTRLITELARQTGATVQIDARRAARPLGIEWLGLRLSLGDRPGVSIARTTGVLSWVEALQGKPVVRVSVWLEEQAAKPSMTAKATFTDWTFQRLAAIDGTTEGVDLQKAAGGPIRSGRARATFQFAGGSASSAWPEGDVRVEVTDLAIAPISSQGIRVPEWGLTSLRAALQCTQQVCRVAEFAGNGPDGSIEASGQILMGRTPEDSRWDVAVTLICSPVFSQRAAAVGGFPLPAGSPLRAKLVGPLWRPQLAL